MAKKISIHQLLSCTSGLPHYNAFEDFLENKDRLFYTKEQLLNLIGAVELDFELGERYRYSSLGYLVLGYIIENIEQADLKTILHNKIFRPYKMLNSSLSNYSPILPYRTNPYRYNYKTAQYDNGNYRDASTTFSAGGIISTANDLLIWDEVLRGDKFLSKKSKEKLFTPIDRNYAYGWRRAFPDRDDNLNIQWHAGQVTGYKSIMVRLPKTGHCIILLSNMRDMAHIDIANQILNILFDKEVVKPRKSLLKTLLKEIVTQDDVDKGIALYFKLKENESTSYSFSETELLVLGIELSNEGLYNEAIKVFQLNLKEDPSSRYRINNYMLLGQSFEAVNNNKEALNAYNEILKINPNQSSAKERINALSN